MEKLTATVEELTVYLRELGIREEGIEKIIKTFPLGEQRLKMLEITPGMIEDGRTPKQAVEVMWQTIWKVAILRQEEVGEEPTDEDILML